MSCEVHPAKSYTPRCPCDSCERYRAQSRERRREIMADPQRRAERNRADRERRRKKTYLVYCPERGEMVEDTR